MKEIRYLRIFRMIKKKIFSPRDDWSVQSFELNEPEYNILTYIYTSYKCIHVWTFHDSNNAINIHGKLEQDVIKNNRKN